MSTPSTLLLCAGAASSLAAVWTLAGFSESSTPRFTPRVLGAGGLGLLGALSVYGRTPVSVRSQLSLGMLFALASIAALVVGVAKLEGALAEKDGQRVVRRSAGIVAGTFFGMAAIGAAALDLSQSSLIARATWSLMFGLVLGTLVVFVQRARYAGAGLKALGGRAAVLGLIVAALFAGVSVRIAAAAREGRVTASGPTAVAIVPPSAEVVAPPAPSTPEAPAASASAPEVAASAPAPASAAPSASGAPVASAAAAPAVAGKPGELQIETITTRGLLEADVRGGVSRRMERLQACLADPKNQQSGVLTLKVGIDPSGSVTYTRPTGGDLSGTPLAACLLLVFYKMGFAAPASNSANFEITLRAPPP